MLVALAQPFKQIGRWLLAQFVVDKAVEFPKGLNAQALEHALQSLGKLHHDRCAPVVFPNFLHQHGLPGELQGALKIAAQFLAKFGALLAALGSLVDGHRVFDDLLEGGAWDPFGGVAFQEAAGDARVVIEVGDGARVGPF